MTSAQQPQSLWLQFLEALQQTVQTKPGEALQVVYPFQSWDWNGRAPMPNAYSYEQWQILNVVPAAPYLNTNSSPAEQSGFDVAYGNWINTLAIGDLATDTHYAALQDQVTQAAGTVTTDYQNAQNTWMNQTGGTGLSFTQWLAEPQNIGYSSKINSDQQTLTGLQTQLANYQAEIEAPVMGVLTAYNDPDNQTYVTDPNSGKSVQKRIWSTSPSSPWAYLEEITAGTFGGPATAGSPTSFTISSSSQEYNASSLYGEGAGAALVDFIEIEGEGSYSKVEWSQFDSEYSITFGFEDFRTVTVTPDSWYSGGDVASYAQGPYATGFSEFQSGNDNYFFGPGGALSRIYTSLIVGYRPKVTLSAGSSFAQYLQQQWQAETGVMIGPFLFEGSGSGETTSSTATVSNNEIVLTSTADWPVIVGMTSAWTISPTEQEA